MFGLFKDKVLNAEGVEVDRQRDLRAEEVKAEETQEIDRPGWLMALTQLFQSEASPDQ